MRYCRSNTAMCDVALFTPATQLQMGALPTGPGGSFLGIYDVAPRIPADVEALWPLDAADGFITDALSAPRYILGGLGQEVGFDTDILPGQPAADAALPSTAPGASDGGWNWQGMIEKAPAVLRDLMLATSAADYQSQLNKINLERARQGLPPLDPAQYGPTVRVGVTPQTAKIAGIGAGTFLAVAVASAFGITAMTRRRGRRR